MTGRPAAAVLTRRRALTTLAALAGGSGLLDGCTSAASRPDAAASASRAATDTGAAPAVVVATPTPAPARPTPATAPVNVYAGIAPGKMNPRWARDKVRVYVPNSLSSTVTEIDPRTYRVTTTFDVGIGPNHVTPSWDGSVLWVNNTVGGSLTPINPRTGRAGSPVAVADPYNLYFTPDGQYALVMAEALNRIDFCDPHTMAPRYRMQIPAAGINHLDFTADGNYALGSCEFSGSVVWIDMRARKVVAKHTLGRSMDAPLMPPGPGYSMPQDVRLSADGTIFYVADMAANGVWLMSASQFKLIRFIRTGAGTHGFEVGRDGRHLYISNRGEGSISVLDMTTNKLAAKWRIPGGGSPDMGGISPDGTVMWWGGRYNGVVYAMSTANGRLLAKIPVGAGPHGVCVFPQPGRYSLGHTGNFR
jgi:YVTN family beta-propeller protein